MQKEQLWSGRKGHLIKIFSWNSRLCPTCWIKHSSFCLTVKLCVFGGQWSNAGISNNLNICGLTNAEPAKRPTAEAYISSSQWETSVSDHHTPFRSGSDSTHEKMTKVLRVTTKQLVRLLKALCYYHDTCLKTWRYHAPFYTICILLCKKIIRENPPNSGCMCVPFGTIYIHIHMHIYTVWLNDSLLPLKAEGREREREKLVVVESFIWH